MPRDYVHSYNPQIKLNHSKYNKPNNRNLCYINNMYSNNTGNNNVIVTV